VSTLIPFQSTGPGGAGPAAGPPAEPAGLPAVTAGLSRRRQVLGGALLLLGLPALTAAQVAHRDQLSYATPVLLVLVLVVAVALVGGATVALPGAVLGGLALNWYLTPPYGTLAVSRPQHLLVLLVYLGVAVAVSVVVGLAARRTAEAARARAEARALTTLVGPALAEHETLPDLLERARGTFRMREVVLVDTAHGDRSVVARVGHGTPEPGEVELRVPAGPDALLLARGPGLFAQDQRVLTSFAEAAGTALQGRRLAEQARAAAVLEAADRVRTALLAAVGHDLRTPLAGIKAAASSLRQHDVDFTDDEREELLETIDTSTDRLQALVANLLDASRLQAGAVPVHVEPTGVGEVLTHALLALPGDARSRVRLDLPDELPDALADPVLLERVVANLVDNALRHSGPAPGVTLRAGEQPGAVTCEVVDHGPGVTPAQRQQLFVAFQRLGDSRPGGLGLGLAVASGFVDAMGGALEPADTPGGGLTMRITLPRAPDASTPAWGAP
jgi:K+-sensing histidine kinase KdpD